MDCKSRFTPMVVQTVVAKSPDPPQAAIHFRQLVGLLRWIKRHTHLKVVQPDIHLVQFCTCYVRDHLLAVLRVLKHLNTAKDRTFRIGLQHRTLPDTARLSMYSDSDWAISSTDHNSCSWIVIYSSGDFIAWFTHKQPAAASSSTDADRVYRSIGRL